MVAFVSFSLWFEFRPDVVFLRIYEVETFFSFKIEFVGLQFLRLSFYFALVATSRFCLAL